MRRTSHYSRSPPARRKVAAGEDTESGPFGNAAGARPFRPLDGIRPPA